MDMKKTCKQMEEFLPDLAEGKSLPEVQSHVDTCPVCAMKVEQFRTILKAATVPVVSAPTSLIDSVKLLEPGRKKDVRARLFGSSLTLAHARSSATDFQLAVGNEDHKIRVMYSRSPLGKWEVTGRAPSKDWKVVRGTKSKPVDAQGGFVFEVGALEDTAFSLRLNNEELQIPSAQELLDGEST